MADTSITEKQQEAISALFVQDPTIKKVDTSNASTSSNAGSGWDAGGGGGGTQIQKIAEDLGLEVLQPATALERTVEINTALNLLNHNENIMILGDAGTGKTTLVQHIAKELATIGKTVISIPSTYFQSHGKAGGTASAIDSLIKAYSPAQLKNIVFFIDEIHSAVNMGTFGIGDQDHETPRNLLKPYLTGVGDSRLVIIGATTTKEYQERLFNRDQAFCRRFQNIELQNFTLEQMQRIMLDRSTIETLKKSGFKIDDTSDSDREKYTQVTTYSCMLLDKFAKYQAFPEKSAKFFKRLLAGKNIKDITQEQIESLISSTLHIPIEFITKEILADSRFLSLGAALKEDIIGQDTAIDHITSKVLRFIKDEPNKPISFLSMGNTGVGKTQTVEELSSDLGLPLIKFNMGEYKTKDTVKDFVKILTNYVRNNYTGVILFDELEKADSNILDAILSLTDKGQIGSGDSLVTSKSQIIFMTSNMICEDLTECAEVLKEDGHDEIPERLLRLLIQEQTNLRPEFLARIDSVLHYKNISLENTLIIATKILNKKINSFKENSGINFEIDKDSFNNIINNCCQANDVRTIGKNLDDFFEQILGNHEVILQLKNQVFVGKINKTPNKITVSITEVGIALNVNGTPITLQKVSSCAIEFPDVLSRMREIRDSKTKTIVGSHSSKSTVN
jgi:ATP-dependent Clp protease ATP-binding subunit ClpA